MSPEQYESLTTELNAAQAASLALTPRLLGGEQVSAAEIDAAKARLHVAGHELYAATVASARSH